jgi:hypothetical protein
MIRREFTEVITGRKIVEAIAKTRPIIKAMS